MALVSGGGSVSPATLGGYEIGYAQITAAVNITDTLEATATALISSGAITFDGAAVVLDVYAPYLQAPNNATSSAATLTLFEGATEIARLMIISCQTAGVNNLSPVRLSYRFTPSAGAHTYKLCGFVSSTTGTPQLGAGAGGTGAYAPAFMRFTKV